MCWALRNSQRDVREPSGLVSASHACSPRRLAARSTQTGPEHTLPRDLTNTPPRTAVRRLATRSPSSSELGRVTSRAHAAARRALTRRQTEPLRARGGRLPIMYTDTDVTYSETADRHRRPRAGTPHLYPLTTKPTQHGVPTGWVGGLVRRRAPDAPRVRPRRRPREDPTS